MVFVPLTFLCHVVIGSALLQGGKWFDTCGSLHVPVRVGAFACNFRQVVPVVSQERGKLEDSGCYLHNDFFQPNWTKEELGNLPAHLTNFFDHSDTIAEIILTGVRAGEYGYRHYQSAGTWFGTVRRIREDRYHLKIDESSLLPSDERSNFYKDFAAERHRFLIGLVRELELYRFNFTNALSCCKLAQPQKTLAKMFDKILSCQPFGKSDIKNAEDLLGLFEEIETHPNWLKPNDSRNRTLSKSLQGFKKLEKRYLRGPIIFGLNKPNEADASFESAIGHDAKEPPVIAKVGEMQDDKQIAYEKAKDEFLLWATARGLNVVDSENRLNVAQGFLKSLHGKDRLSTVQQLSKKMAGVEKEPLPSQFCIFDQLKSAHYLDHERFMPLVRVLLQDLQIAYNNANICRYLAEGGYDVAVKGAFDLIDKMTIKKFVEIYENVLARLDYLRDLTEKACQWLRSTGILRSSRCILQKLS